MAIKWETPPPNARARREYDAVRDSLAQSPGAWARVAEGLNLLESRRYYTGLRARGLTVRIRKQEDDTFHLYAQYPAP